MKLLVHYIRTELNKIHKNNIKIQTMGDISKLPKPPEKKLKGQLNYRKQYKNDLNIGLNYGGRDEIIQGVKNILKDINMGNIKEEDINEDLF